MFEELLRAMRSDDPFFLLLSPILLPFMAVYYLSLIVLEAITFVSVSLFFVVISLFAAAIVIPPCQVATMLFDLCNINHPNYFSRLSVSFLTLCASIVGAGTIITGLYYIPALIISIDMMVALALTVYNNIFAHGESLPFTMLQLAAYTVTKPIEALIEHIGQAHADHHNSTVPRFNHANIPAMTKLKQDEESTELLIQKASKPEYALLTDAEKTQLQAHPSAEIRSLLETYTQLSKPQCVLSLEEATIDGSETGIVVEKQYYQPHSNQYYFIPGHSHFYNKAMFEQMLMSNPLSPLCPVSRDPLLGYAGDTTRYVWYPFSHRLDDGRVVILRRECHPIIAQLRQHLSTTHELTPPAPMSTPTQPPAPVIVSSRLTSDAVYATDNIYAFFPSPSDSAEAGSMSGLPTAERVLINPIPVTTAIRFDGTLPQAEPVNPYDSNAASIRETTMEPASVYNASVRSIETTQDNDNGQNAEMIAQLQQQLMELNDLAEFQQQFRR